MDLIFRCIGCGKSERKVLEDPVIFEVPSNVDSGIFLSRECYKNFCEEQGDKNGLKIINKLIFPHESCIDLYGPSGD